MAATLGYVVLEVGEYTAAAILVAFIPMLFTAFAYRELNRAVPDCGTTFTWGTKAFGPVGRLDGRLGRRARRHDLPGERCRGRRRTTSTARSTRSASSRPTDLADNTAAVTSLGALSIALMTYVSYRGIEISARIQNLLVYFQYGVLVVFVRRRCSASS